ncbi:MAG TPA: plastocyanin/azurin family copper-binding protein [Candidatus Limnocylindria bacterium]|nr:plastocyanin/azurin family copper-binding protein [Candidatus Limnocylindria bacterium]
MRRAGLILALVLAACTPPAPAFSPTDVGLIVELTDHKILPSAPSVETGTMRVGIRNRGGQPHDVIFIRTELAPDRLPYDASRAQAREEGVVARTDVIPPGGTRRLDVALPPGRYVLICNVPGHYALGMRTVFEVKG